MTDIQSVDDDEVQKEKFDFFDKILTGKSNDSKEIIPKVKTDLEALTDQNNIDTNNEVKDLYQEFLNDGTDRMKNGLDKSGFEDFKVYSIKEEKDNWYKAFGKKLWNGVKKHKSSLTLTIASLATLGVGTLYFGAIKNHDRLQTKHIESKVFMMPPQLPKEFSYGTNTNISKNFSSDNKLVAPILPQGIVEDTAKNVDNNHLIQKQSGDKNYLRFGDQEWKLISNIKDITFEKYLKAVKNRGFTGAAELITGKKMKSKDYSGIIGFLATLGNVDLSNEDLIWERIHTNPMYRYNGINDKAFENDVRKSYNSLQTELKSNMSSDIKSKKPISRESTNMTEKQSVSPITITKKTLENNIRQDITKYNHVKKDEVKHENTKQKYVTKDWAKQKIIIKDESKKEYITKDTPNFVRYFGVNSNTKSTGSIDTKIKNMFDNNDGFSLTDPFMKEYFKTRKVDVNNMNKVNESIVQKLKKDYNDVLLESASLYNKAKSSGLTHGKSLEYVVKTSDKAILNNKTNVYEAIRHANDKFVKENKQKDVTIFSRWDSKRLPDDARSYIKKVYDTLTNNGTEKLTKSKKDYLKTNIKEKYSSEISDSTIRRFITVNSNNKPSDSRIYISGRPFVRDVTKNIVKGYERHMIRNSPVIITNFRSPFHNNHLVAGRIYISGKPFVRYVTKNIVKGYERHMIRNSPVIITNPRPPSHNNHLVDNRRYIPNTPIVKDVNKNIVKDYEKQTINKSSATVTTFKTYNHNILSEAEVRQIIDEQFDFLRNSDDKYKMTPEIAEVVDKNFVLAVFYNESGYNKHAHSPKHAEGMGQVTKGEWNQVESKYPFETYKYDPEINARVSIKSMIKTAGEYKNDNPRWNIVSKTERQRDIAAAYNQGRNGFRSTNFNIERTPRETKIFVRNVSKLYTIINNNTNINTASSENNSTNNYDTKNTEYKPVSVSYPR